MQPFGIESVLKRTLGIWGSQIWALTALSAVAFVPAMLMSVYTTVTLDVSTDAVDQLDPLIIAETIVSIVCQGMLTGAACFLAIERLRGRTVTMAQAFAVGLPRLSSVIGVSLLSAICIFAGFMALIVPGFIVTAMLQAAVPATVVERLDPVRSLVRSAKLTEGLRLPVLAASFAIGLVAAIPSMVMGQAMAGAETLAAVKFGLWVQLFITVALAPAGAVCATVIYNDLRAVKDGVDPETLAASFD